jgi:DNA modification methylase
LVHGDAAELDKLSIFSKEGKKASLVVTSPPYPGVHVLYHRWQVDGRRETPAPYWIINRDDGQYASYYTFGDRQSTTEAYFIASLRTLQSIRRVIKKGGFVVQLVAFNKPEVQLSRYLSNMAAAGFEEVALNDLGEMDAEKRIWREVPNRKWHAASKGKTHSSREVVLVHRAV